MSRSTALRRVVVTGFGVVGPVGLDAATVWPLIGHEADATGAFIGSGAGGIATHVAQQAVLDQDGPRRLNPLSIPMICCSVAAETTGRATTTAAAIMNAYLFM